MRRVHIHMHADIYTHILHVQRRAVGSALNYSLGVPCHSQALFCRPASASLVGPSLQRHMWREEEEKRNRTQQLFKKEKHRTSREREE